MGDSLSYLDNLLLGFFLWFLFVTLYNSFFLPYALYIQRLAYLSEKQVQKDQRKVEDTTSFNRPSEVEKDFNAFFEDERMDACEKMQELYGSEEESEVFISYPRLACMIFEVRYPR